MCPCVSLIPKAQDVGVPGSHLLTCLLGGWAWKAPAAPTRSSYLPIKPGACLQHAQSHALGLPPGSLGRELEEVEKGRPRPTGAVLSLRQPAMRPAKAGKRLSAVLAVCLEAAGSERLE